jgi:DNA relaxase NicK
MEKNWMIIIVVSIIGTSAILIAEKICNKDLNDPIAQRIEQVTNDVNLTGTTKERLITEIVQKAQKDTIYKDTSDPVANRIEKVLKGENLLSSDKEKLIREIIQQAKKDTIYRDTCLKVSQ